MASNDEKVATSSQPDFAEASMLEGTPNPPSNADNDAGAFTVNVPVRHGMTLTKKRLLDTKELTTSRLKIQKSGDRFIDAFRRRVMEMGPSGYVMLRKIFLSFDVESDEGLAPAELADACQEMGMELTMKDFKDMFEQMDLDNPGAITFNEFIQHVRPPIGLRRQDLVLRAYKLLTRDGQTPVTMAEMAELYDASQHPDVLSGLATEDDIMKRFLDDWGREPDTLITKPEFVNYYADVSANIADDDYFELMIRNAWHLSGGEGPCRNTTCLRVMVSFEDGRKRIVECRDDLRLDPTDMKAVRDCLRKQGLENITKIEPIC